MEKRKAYIVRLEDGQEFHSPFLGQATKRAEYEARFGHTAEIIECQLIPGEVIQTITPVRD